MSFNVKALLMSAAVAAVVAPAAQALEGGDMIVRFGAVKVAPNVDSGPVSLNGAPTFKGVEVSDDTQFGISGTYMLAPTVGIELLAATPFEHDITLEEGVKVGSTKHLPPTLSVQYYPLGASQSKWQPYLGLGVNYTTFFSESVDPELEAALGAPAEMELDDSWGLAGQVGVDYYINDKWLINASAMYADINTSATITADNGNVAKVDADLDPWVYRLNVGYKF
ncbi:outer membrane protein [Sinobacterium caligoides]|uniref:Outer membrane protein n=1 Tax=Sinobacterium caligoides TaxID=933926 RepID=A0A3N2E036_9GAMM|nr:OmpW family outer membrane protein [Sinobacterium caligoides]ROS05272.1 outer membrane protein [Sinobacterium caligoides]